ncbi:MAG: hypothetical protein JWQ11_3009, partial [Rhizobacter sp.]|nr:hypothetical protein [Rhizobacter sp.]
MTISTSPYPVRRPSTHVDASTAARPSQTTNHYWTRGTTTGGSSIELQWKPTGDWLTRQRFKHAEVTALLQNALDTLGNNRNRDRAIDGLENPRQVLRRLVHDLHKSGVPPLRVVVRVADMAHPKFNAPAGAVDLETPLQHALQALIDSPADRLTLACEAAPLLKDGLAALMRNPDLGRVEDAARAERPTSPRRSPSPRPSTSSDMPTSPDDGSLAWPISAFVSKDAAAGEPRAVPPLINSSPTPFNLPRSLMAAMLRRDLYKRPSASTDVVSGGSESEQPVTKRRRPPPEGGNPAATAAAIPLQSAAAVRTAPTDASSRVAESTGRQAQDPLGNWLTAMRELDRIDIAVEADVTDVPENVETRNLPKEVIEVLKALGF